MLLNLKMEGKCYQNRILQLALKGDARHSDVALSPLVLRTFAREDIVSLKENLSWRHNDFVKDYSQAELEDIGVYLRWATEGK